MREEQPINNPSDIAHVAEIIDTRSEESASLRDILKRATSAAHVALEATALMRAVSSGVPSHEAYASYLSCHWRVHVGLEAMLATQLPASWTNGRLLKSAWLATDLQALGRPLPEAPAPVPRVRSIAQALGVMYVLEGATLGLAVVTRRLPPSHPAIAGAGRFMAAYGSRTGSRWSEFQRMLATVDRAKWPSACAAANATFSSFQQVFDAGWLSSD
jgi:heme oxygenase